MQCFQHADREATAFCRTCGRALCGEDQREIYCVVYCQECLARQMGQTAAPRASAANPYAADAIAAPASHLPSPGVALLLGFIPGVGAVYNGQYLKAFLQVVVFGFLISLKDWAWGLHTVAGLACVVFYFYMVFDSYRTAKLLSQGQPAPELWTGAPGTPVNAPVAALVLIAIGCLYLMRSFGFFAFDVSRYLWPALLIGIGVWLLQRRRGA